MKIKDKADKSKFRNVTQLHITHAIHQRLGELTDRLINNPSDYRLVIEVSQKEKDRIRQEIAEKFD